MLKDRNVRELNVGKVHFTSDAGTTEQCYFINVADIGMGPEVVRKVLRSGRPFGSGVAYYKSILSTFFTYRMMEVEAKSEHWRWKNKVRTFAVANGKYYGHGLCIAPDAMPDDNQFEVFACADVSILDFIIQSGPLKKRTARRASKSFLSNNALCGVNVYKTLRDRGRWRMVGMAPGQSRISADAVEVFGTCSLLSLEGRSLMYLMYSQAQGSLPET